MCRRVALGIGADVRFLQCRTRKGVENVGVGQAGFEGDVGDGHEPVRLDAGRGVEGLDVLPT